MKQLLRSSRQNLSPVKRIDRSFLMPHEHAARTLIKLLQIGKTPSGTDPVFQHAPEAFDGIEVVSTPGWEYIQAKPLVPVRQRGRELMGPVDATPVHDHDHLFPDMAKARHHLMDIVTKPLGIKLGDDLIEDFRGAILHGADDAEQHAIGDTAPGAILGPCLTFERLFAGDLAVAQGLGRQAKALGFAAPPTCPGQSKTPEDRFIFIEQNNLTPPGVVLQRRQVE
jgi:hypothetical protein